MALVNIWYSKLEMNRAAQYLGIYWNLLPPLLQQQNIKYTHLEDRIRNLFGKMLLLRGLRHHGFGQDILNNLRLDDFGRPFLDYPVDFNISHSGDYALCAVSCDSRTGIDIEEIKPISIKDYEMCFTVEEIKDITSATCFLQAFYTYWTRKECIIKGDKRGMSLSLKSFSVRSDEVILGWQKWFISRLDIDVQYSAHLACSRSDIQIELTRVVF